MNKETGGPAFPRNGLFHQDTLVRERCEIEPQEGMTLRDYFIAHAPAEPQPWFEPVMPEKPLLPSWTAEGLTPAQREQAEQVMDYDETVSDTKVMDFAASFLAAKKKLDEWETNRKKQRYTQWPAAWADEMLKQRQ